MLIRIHHYVAPSMLHFLLTKYVLIRMLCSLSKSWTQSPGAKAMAPEHLRPSSLRVGHVPLLTACAPRQVGSMRQHAHQSHLWMQSTHLHASTSMFERMIMMPHNHWLVYATASMMMQLARCHQQPVYIVFRLTLQTDCIAEQHHARPKKEVLHNGFQRHRANSSC